MPDYTSFRIESAPTSSRSYASASSVREKLEEESVEDMVVFESNLDNFEDAENDIWRLLEMETIDEENSIYPINAP